MALIETRTFESPNYANGDTPVAGAFGVVAVTATCTVTTASAIHGSLGLHVSGGGSINYTAGATGTVSVYGQINTTGTSPMIACGIRNGATFLARIRANQASHQWDLTDQSSTVADTSTGTAVWANGTPFRLDTQWTYTSPNITVTVRIFMGSNVEGFTPDDTITGTFASASVPNRFSFGTTTVTYDAFFDTYRSWNDTAAWPTPYGGAAPSATGVPAAVDSNNGWVDNAGGTTGLVTSQTDSSDTTYDAAPTTTGGHALRFKITPMIAGGSASITARMALSGAVTDTTVVNLYEGATLRQTWTTTTDFGPVTTTITDYVLNLTSGTIAAIVDWTNLYLEYVWTV